MVKARRKPPPPFAIERLSSLWRKVSILTAEAPRSRSGDRRRTRGDPAHVWKGDGRMTVSELIAFRQQDQNPLFVTGLGAVFPILPYAALSRETPPAFLGGAQPTLWRWACCGHCRTAGGFLCTKQGPD